MDAVLRHFLDTQVIEPENQIDSQSADGMALAETAQILRPVLEIGPAASTMFPFVHVSMQCRVGGSQKGSSLVKYPANRQRRWQVSRAWHIIVVRSGQKRHRLGAVTIAT